MNNAQLFPKRELCTNDKFCLVFIMSFSFFLDLIGLKIKTIHHLTCTVAILFKYTNRNVSFVYIAIRGK